MREGTSALAKMAATAKRQYERLKRERAGRLKNETDGRSSAVPFKTQLGVTMDHGRQRQPRIREELPENNYLRGGSTSHRYYELSGASIPRAQDWT